MTIDVKTRETFQKSVEALLATETGKEASMYTVLRDLFTEVLGYPRTSVVADVSGHRGRPDVTVFAPGGNDAGRVSWIVLEAKDEKGAVAKPKRRQKLFAEKAKYITADTAFFCMVDPDMIVVRAVGARPAPDVELPLRGATIEKFLEAFWPLRAAVAGVPHQLAEFRQGNEDLIARDRLSVSPGQTASDEERLAVNINRNVFFDTLGETTQMLQRATLRALDELGPQRQAIAERVDAFGAKYGGFDFKPYPIGVEGRTITGREMEREHRRDAAELRKFLVQDPAISRLTLNALPRFAERTGLDLDEDGAQILRFFANETANLILARILLIRFLEDHGFFDQETANGVVRRRYLCNGGVAAFQSMKDYFGHGYTRLLEEAYRTGGHFYSSAFDETEMDWVIAMSSPDLSRTLEWSLFRMSRFDFATARGDLMTGVYDRFLDRKQRKDQGEFYTPPSIARFILDRLSLPDDAKVIDPACGSGTFLIERYRQVYGEIADSGTGDYADARAAVERLYGNDLNPFSAVLTQIQLLWHLLAFGDEIREQGFPDLHIAERANSLIPGALYDPSQSRFGEIDQTGYDAVVGNPPYVRRERAGDVEAHMRDYFTGTRSRGEMAFAGVGASANAYTLFLYRALDHWCRQPGDESREPGKVGFILPLALCVAKESAAFRKLLLPGGRFAVREIVDMELIWPEVFDADVLPMIVIIQAMEARHDDEVLIRLADESTVHYEDGAKRPTFRFDHLPERRVAYHDLFTPDGRMLTRLTPERVEIIRKLRANPTFADAAMPFWARAGHPSRLEEPTGIGAGQWHRDRMIKDGFAKRGNVHFLKEGGYTTYKGENISTAMLNGDPVMMNLDVSRTSSASVWSQPDILPPVAYALPIIERVPVAAPFNPKTVAVENTAVVFAPRVELASVPFDALLVSHVYGFFHILANRRSFQNKLRNHIYPVAVADLPWNEGFLARADALVGARETLLAASRRRYEQSEAMDAEIGKLDVVELKMLVRERKSKVAKPDIFTTEPDIVVAVGELEDVENGWFLALSSDSEHGILFQDEDVAKLARVGLQLVEGEEVTWSGLLSTPVPRSGEAAEAIGSLLEQFNPQNLEDAVETAIRDIDVIVGEVLGLTEAEISLVQEQMRDDPFLSQAKPRLPYFRARQFGRRLNLERRDRYAT